jgi:hypothetical protein
MLLCSGEREIIRGGKLTHEISHAQQRLKSDPKLKTGKFIYLDSVQ